MKLFISTVKSLIGVAIFAAAVCLLPKHAMAQSYTTAGQMSSDTASVSVIPQVDSSLVGVSVFDLLNRGGADNSVENGGSGRTGLNGKVVLHQDSYMKTAFESYVKSNAERSKNGYRIMVFTSNAQSARGESESIASQFNSMYPGLGVYRSYANPFFKVTVGDFRIKSDALKLYNEILGRYPRAKIIKDKINWCQF
jgi:hypothetical protein